MPNSTDEAGPIVSIRRWSLSDPAEIGEVFGDGVEYVPSRRQPYRLDAEFVSTSTLSVEWLSHHGEVFVEEETPGRQIFAVFGDFADDLSVDGVAARRNSIAAATIEPRVARLRGPNHYALVNVPGCWLDTCGEGMRYLDAPRKRHERLVTLITQVRNLSHDDGVGEASLRSACESVADALQSVLDSVEPTSSGEPDVANQIVIDAIAAIREERATTIAELTRAVAASRSSLYRSFESVVGMSPYAYLQQRRLIRLRRRLLEADDEPGVVTREAASLGAFHLGNLAKSYRDLFGELPSDTAKRTISALPGDDLVFADGTR